MKYLFACYGFGLGAFEVFLFSLFFPSKHAVTMNICQTIKTT